MSEGSAALGGNSEHFQTHTRAPFSQQTRGKSAMCVLRMWRLFCLLGALGSCLCVNEVEYEGNYVDNYDNEISEDQQEGDSHTTPCHGDLSQWDKLSVALEDSHMRQNMLLEAVEQCCAGRVSLKNLVDKLARGAHQQCAPGLESACRAQAEDVSQRLQRGLEELSERETQRERRLNATLQMLLHSGHEGNARLKRLEHAVPSRPTDSRTGPQPTPGPGGWGTFDSGAKPITSVLKEQEVTSPPDIGTMERALVSIATELQRLHLQLNKVIEQTGALRRDRGDT
ncbi:uncharacterized protein LOC115407318 [Salarias fasciatus]|uniref:Uncharacterized LOC115407318 n=1 Tax=Salarias fasciatus TaxID=181472 RepID=A0A672JH94_SALFA|nr:uncharacterized protein LOC115407318 [Salarias fasciatus]